MKILPILFFMALVSCESTPQPPNPTPIDTTTPAKGDLITERPTHYPGFIPTSTTSKYHTATPELNGINPKDAFVVTPNLGGWDKVNWSKGLILIKQGDYLSWGPLTIPVSGTKGNPIVVMYYSDKVEHAYKTDQIGKAVIIESFEQRKPLSYATISGLTFKGNTWSKDGHKGSGGIFLAPGSSDVKIVNCFGWQWRGARLFGDRIVFQDNVVAGSPGIRGDHGGIGIHTTKEHGSYDCRIVGNEILDQNNLVGCPKDGKEDTLFQFVNGTVIADNDLYYTADSWIEEDGKMYSCGGSAIDIKNGSDDPIKPLIIEGNRIAYIYTNPPSKTCGDNNGKLGEGIILHKDARNTVIQNNAFYKASRGIMIYSGINRGMNTYNVLVQNNLIHTIEETVKGSTGFAIHSATVGVDIINNTFIGCNRFTSEATKTKYRLDFRGNRYIGQLNGIPSSNSKVTVEDNYISEASDIMLSDLVIPWHRFTGPDTLIIPSSVAGKDQLQKIGETYTQSQTANYLQSVWFKDIEY